MPPKKQTTAEQIFEKAFEMVRQEGYSSLTTRKLAKALNCSTQPIYQAYSDMNELKLALTEKAYEMMIEFIALNRDANLPIPLTNVLGYVRFANVEKHLFQLIFTSGGANHNPIEGLVPKEIGSQLNIIIYANGIVMMAAYDALGLSPEIVKELIIKAYYSFEQEAENP